MEISLATRFGGEKVGECGRGEEPPGALVLGPVDPSLGIPLFKGGEQHKSPGIRCKKKKTQKIHQVPPKTPLEKKNRAKGGKIGVNATGKYATEAEIMIIMP